MKNICNIIILLLYSNSIQSQSVVWSSHLRSNQYDFAYGKPTNNGDYYLFGRFYGADLFSTGQTLHSTENGDMFLMKFDNAGNIVWNKQLICTNQSQNCITQSGPICIDESNNCFYISGNFCGNLQVDNFNINSLYTQDGYVAKFDFNGNCLWLKGLQGSGTIEEIHAMDIDINGNLYITGTNSQNLTFDSCAALGGSYILSISPSGNCLWFKDISTFCAYPGFVIARILCTNSNLFVTGTVVNMDTIQLDTLQLLHPGYNTNIISSFDFNGNILWAKEIKYPRNATPFVSGISSMTLDNNNNIYLSGYFYDTLIYDGNTYVSQVNSIQPYPTDLYIMKMDPLGNLIRFQQLHSTSRSTGISINSGNLLLTGKLIDTAYFDSTPIIPVNNQELFIAKYDTSGNFNSVYHAGYCDYSSIFQDNFGSIYSAIVFNGSFQINNQTYSSIGDDDVLIVKFNSIDYVPNNNRLDKDDLVIYTNPSRGQCKVKIPEKFNNVKHLILSIYTDTGEMIYQNNFNTESHEISMNLDKEAKGIYMVTLSDGKQIYRGKIVFE